MSTDANKAIVRRIYEEVISKGNLALLDELCAPDIVDHAALPGSPPGREGVRQWFTLIRTAFPDTQVTVEDLIAEGDKVVARVRPEGTQHGEFLGIPPTGKYMTITAMDMFRVADGKIVEHWGEQDMLGLLQQLGAIPTPEQAPREGGT
jgi:steroid delta-isomerase-like uncharacterized protein